MKAVPVSCLAVLLAALPIIASSAGSDKIVQNLKGTVTYGQAAPHTAPTQQLALHAQTTINDTDSVGTSADSEAAITLPDSSKVFIGQNSNVQMTLFDNSTAIAKANFVVDGKVRFQVEHPNGGRANYTFSTGTGQIAVRGTVGDIFSGPQGMQVNVYAISNPSLPVQVTLANGQVFSLAAGQSLVVGSAAAGAVTSAVTTVSHSLYQPFSEFGAPANVSGAVGSAIGTTTAATTSAVATTTAAAAAAGTAAAVTVANNSTKSTPAPTPTPTLSPTPAPTSTSVSICVDSRPHTGSKRPMDSATCAPATPAPTLMHGNVMSPVGPHMPGARPSPQP